MFTSERDSESFAISPAHYDKLKYKLGWHFIAVLIIVEVDHADLWLVRVYR